MDCPVCKETKLVMTERQNIEIDYCPTCRGVWLDRGELDKIIEKSQQYETQSVVQSSQTNSFLNPRVQPLPFSAPQQPYVEYEPGQSGHVSEHYRSERHRSDHGRASSHGGFLKRLFD